MGIDITSLWRYDQLREEVSRKEGVGSEGGRIQQGDRSMQGHQYEE